MFERYNGGTVRGRWAWVVVYRARAVAQSSEIQGTRRRHQPPQSTRAETRVETKPIPGKAKRNYRVSCPLGIMCQEASPCDSAAFVAPGPPLQALSAAGQLGHARRLWTRHPWSTFPPTHCAALKKR